MLVGPTRGLLWFSPVAVIGAWAAARAINDPKRRWLPYFSAACASLIIFISFRTTWAGGLTFGTRYFSLVIMILLAALADEEDWISRNTHRLNLWSAALGISIVVHALGAFFLYPGEFYNQITQESQAWSFQFHPAVDLFRVDGSLGALGAFRFLLGGLILGAAIPIAFWNKRFLSGRDAESKTPSSS